MPVKLLFIHALTSIHPGTGQGVGTIDLPVCRERATNLPVIPGSMLKGCLKATRAPNAEETRVAFGTADQQGILRFSDGRLLLLPVRALGSTFVWATCPYVLRRFRRDCALLKMDNPPALIPDPAEGVADISDIAVATPIGGKPRLVLEDLDFDVRQDSAKDWAQWIAARLFPADPEWMTEFQKRFVVLNDPSFDYLCEYATEVNAHIKIGEGGVVDQGALWYEETLPADPRHPLRWVSLQLISSVPLQLGQVLERIGSVQPAGMDQTHEEATLARAIPLCHDSPVITEEIAKLACDYWNERGRIGGSPEEDWYRAEKIVPNRLNAVGTA